MDFRESLLEHFNESIAVKQACLEGPLIETLARMAEKSFRALKNGNKIILFGNGGSAADAQHIAAELTGRFEAERRPLPALALTVNTSSVTALANDYGFERVFSRQLCALGKPGDVAIGISTSGNSPNVVETLKAATELEITPFGWTGRDKGAMDSWCEDILRVPCTRTARIQEVHILAAHAFCGLLEKLFASSSPEGAHG